MQALAIVGAPAPARRKLVAALVDRLSDRGPVGTITSYSPDATDSHRPFGATQTYGLSDQTWTASGDSLSLAEALDRLAESCAYAVVDGYTDTRLPTVAIGADAPDDALVQAATAAEIEMGTLVETVESVDPYETLGSLVTRVKASTDEDRAGAIATFTGRVRAKDAPDDDPTEYLEFEKYDGVAAEKMDAIRDELEARDGVYDVRLHHRTGVVEAGEDIVFVVVLAGHRTEAFRTVEDGIDRLKEEVPLFKKEVTVSDEFWAHEQ
jgi:molybdopterin synthase catalytic subunit